MDAAKNSLYSKRYLDAYTTALRAQPFRALVYRRLRRYRLGRAASPRPKARFASFVSGSAERAIEIDNKPFDKLIFVEQDAERYAELANLQEKHSHKDIEIENDDANMYLTSLGQDWRGRRGVLFLDPFATQVKWATLERVASYKALDTWILFPVSAISRMLPKQRRPDEIDERWVSRLTTVFWRSELEKSLSKTRAVGLVYRGGLRERPGRRGASRHIQGQTIWPVRRKVPSSLSHFQELPQFLHFSNSLFCAGHPAGAKIAKDIAGQILRNL